MKLFKVKIYHWEKKSDEYESAQSENTFMFAKMNFPQIKHELFVAFFQLYL